MKEPTQNKNNRQQSNKPRVLCVGGGSGGFSVAFQPTTGPLLRLAAPADLDNTCQCVVNMSETKKELTLAKNHKLESLEKKNTAKVLTKVFTSSKFTSLGSVIEIACAMRRLGSALGKCSLQVCGVLGLNF